MGLKLRLEAFGLGVCVVRFGSPSSFRLGPEPIGVRLWVLGSSWSCLVLDLGHGSWIFGENETLAAAQPIVKFGASSQ